MIAPDAIAPLEQQVAEARDRRRLLREPGDIPPQGQDVWLHLADPGWPCVMLGIGTRSQGAAGLAPVVKLKPVRRRPEQLTSERLIGVQARLRGQGAHVLVHVPGPHRCRKGRVSKPRRHRRNGGLMPVGLIRVVPTGWRLAVRRLVASKVSQSLAPNMRCTVYLPT